MPDDTTGGGIPESKGFSQDEVNAIVAKSTRELKAQMESLKGSADELEKLKAKSASDAEKQVQAAIKEKTKELEAKYAEREKAMKTDYAVRSELVRRGFKDGVEKLARVLSVDIEDPDDAKAVSATVDLGLKDMPWAKAPEQAAPPKGPGFPGSAQPPGVAGTTTEWTPERIKEVAQKGEYAKYRAEILEAQRKGLIRRGP